MKFLTFELANGFTLIVPECIYATVLTGRVRHGGSLEAHVSTMATYAAKLDETKLELEKEIAKRNHPLVRVPVVLDPRKEPVSEPLAGP